MGWKNSTRGSAVSLLGSGSSLYSHSWSMDLDKQGKALQQVQSYSLRRIFYTCKDSITTKAIVQTMIPSPVTLHRLSFLKTPANVPSSLKETSYHLRDLHRRRPSQSQRCQRVDIQRTLLVGKCRKSNARQSIRDLRLYISIPHKPSRRISDLVRLVDPADEEIAASKDRSPLLDFFGIETEPC